MRALRAKAVSFLGRIPVLGRALRWYARRYREGSVVTIARGRAAGLKWVRHHRYVNGYWLGIYELPLQEALFRELKPGDVFYDIGANAGFFSLLASRCVGEDGKVFAFEPLPCNSEAIREVFDLNGLANCTLVEAAVSDVTGRVAFAEGADTSTAHIERGGKETGILTVESVALDDFVKTHPAPDLIKMDIEGAEVVALEGAAGLLRGNGPPKLIIELHGERAAREVGGRLRRAGYATSSLDGRALGAGDELPRHVLAARLAN